MDEHETPAGLDGHELALDVDESKRIDQLNIIPLDSYFQPSHFTKLRLFTLMHFMAPACSHDASCTIMTQCFCLFSCSLGFYDFSLFDVDTTFHQCEPGPDMTHDMMYIAETQNEYLRRQGTKEPMTQNLFSFGTPWIFVNETPMHNAAL